MRYSSLAILLALFVVTLALVFLLRSSRASTGPSVAASSLVFNIPTAPALKPPSPEAVAGAPGQKTFYQTPGIEVRYLNTTFKFTFDIPDGFSSEEYPTDYPGAVAAVISNNGNDELDVLAIPSGESGVLTTTLVAQDDPTLSVADAQMVTGPSGLSGLLFTSATSPWGGPAREFWFLYKGVRYELSAPLDDAALVDLAMRTWQWR